MNSVTCTWKLKILAFNNPNTKVLVEVVDTSPLETFTEDSGPIELKLAIISPSPWQKLKHKQDKRINSTLVNNEIIHIYYKKKRKNGNKLGNHYK